MKGGGFVTDFDKPEDLAQKGFGKFWLKGGNFAYVRNNAYARITENSDGVGIYDLDTGELRATLYSLEHGSVVLTPEGYFSGSSDFERYIHFVSGKNVYPYEQFSEIFYRPDLVEKKL